MRLLEGDCEGSRGVSGKLVPLGGLCSRRTGSGPLLVSRPSIGKKSDGQGGQWDREDSGAGQAPLRLSSTMSD